MPSKTIPITILALLAFVAGCTTKGDLGANCRMTRSASTPEAPPTPVQESAVQNPALDYISFGAAECDNLVCLRTAGSTNPSNQDGEAIGYCSAPCVTDADCDATGDGVEGSLVCATVLPEMSALAEDDPVLYDQIFSPGTGASNRYCILPRATGE